MIKTAQEELRLALEIQHEINERMKARIEQLERQVNQITAQVSRMRYGQSQDNK